MSRPFEQLIQAAKDAGFAGDPLTEEILGALQSANTELTTAKTEIGQLIASVVSARKQQPRSGLLTIAVAAGVLAIGASVAALSSRSLTAEVRASRDIEVARVIALKDQEIDALRKANATQIIEITTRLNIALSHAETVSNVSAAAAQTNLESFRKEVENLQATVRQIDAKKGAIQN